MNTKQYTYAAILILMANILFVACSSSTDEPSAKFDDNFEGIVLNIPSKGMTRSAGSELQPTEKEAAINSITIVAYPQEGEGVFSKQTFNNLGSNTYSTDNPADDDYKSINVLLKAGKYHIYVYANIDDDNIFASNGSTALEINEDSEEQLKSANIHSMGLISQSDVNSSVDRNVFLPMSCNYDKLQKSAGLAGNEFDNNTVEVTKGMATKIYANLEFAVSKVRITLINDAASGLDLAKVSNSYENAVKITNIGSKTSLLNIAKSQRLTAVGDIASVSLGNLGDKYAVPSPKPANGWEKWTPTDLTNKTTSNGFWAWQATFYLPERLYGDSESDKSQMTIDFDIDNYDLLEDKAKDLDEFERGTYYDYVGFVQEKIVYLKVSVKKWVYYKFVYELDNE